MSSERNPIPLIAMEPGVEVNEIREQEMCCISCQKSLGFAALKTMAPARGSFAFQIRFACAECGPKTATLSLMEEKGRAQ